MSAAPRHVRVLLVTLALTALAAGASASSDSKTLRINATVGGRAKLTISPLTINFPDADPDLVNRIPATENSVTVTSAMRTGPNEFSDLTCLADGNLVSGPNTIPISRVSWRAGGAGYRNGTMSAIVPRTAGRWRGPGTMGGTFDFFLLNSWTYNVGNYTQTVVYTLTVP